MIAVKVGNVQIAQSNIAARVVRVRKQSVTKNRNVYGADDRETRIMK